ncbi:MAG: TenA family transcriptional regulator [Bradymonadia bacterium]
MTLEQHLALTAEAFDLLGNPYFEALDDGSMTHEAFLRSQRQFFHAVDFFNRPLAALAARIPHTATRMAVVANVWEEHGEGDPSRWHRNTFIELLRRLGDDSGEPPLIGPEVQAFNTLIMGASDDYVRGAACLGAIETLFSAISARIGAGIVGRRWLSEDRMVHYDVHVDLDVDHGRELFDVVRTGWDGPERQRIIEGMRLGVYAFDALYRGLYMGTLRSAPEGHDGWGLP